MPPPKSLSATLDEARDLSTESKHVLSVMDPAHGDVKTVWNPENEDEVKAARETFDRMKAKGYAAFRVKKDGEKAELMRAFDPEAAAIIMAPGIRGG